MNIIEQIKTKIDKLYCEYKDKFHQCGDQYHLGLIDGLDMAERVLDKLESEKPVQKDLEEAAIKYATHKKKSEEKEMETELPMGAYYLVKDSFITGAKWDREKMMKDAVEADVNIYRDLAAGKSWAEFVVEMPINNLGDKVLVIVLPKEDSNE